MYMSKTSVRAFKLIKIFDELNTKYIKLTLNNKFKLLKLTDLLIE